MRSVYCAATVFAAIFAAAPASASFDQYTETIRERERTIDGDHIVREPLQSALDASCTVNSALRSGLAGDSKAVAAAMDAAEEKLAAVAKKIMPIADKEIFRKVALKTPRTITLPWGAPIPVRTGDDILRAIATLAQRSADAIERIKNGKGADDDFAQITANSAEISWLVAEFYGVISI